MKKKKGEIDQYVIIVLGILSFFIITIASLNYVGSTDKYITANQIARKYVLKIESKGYLTPENAAKLRSELTNQGFSNIDLTGTTMSEVKNGEDVFLFINYDQPIRNIDIENFNVKFVNEVQRVQISRSSTAKN
ncbi:hypothetical protein [Clostridium manihotivorum]|uniref:DUF4845 domain-containing protein n=1 Tax=Clostridium manihotivorum TaxID=2320868 RepID=A0A3R5QU65_9CLOT|nr:hypothetical protein [Clostridium manihotivorum]QAA32711.1 hypothetical protein C1I91_14300 [Clostridium manihotivorum]